jgi:Arc-like DNA binding domain
MKTKDTSNPEQKLTVRLSQETLGKLRQMAVDHQRSLNSEIVWGLQLYITENRRKGVE